MDGQEAASELPKVTTIWDELEAWAKDFLSWQRLALALIVRHGVLTASQIDQIYAVFLHGYGLADEPNPKVDIPATITGKSGGLASQKPRLSRIYGVSGVNALAASAELTFSPQLTLVYGGNGAGKSGFARILTNVCFSRTKHEILPDIYDDTASKVPTATIALVDHSGAEVPFTFDGTAEHPDLKNSFAVFDSFVAGKHLKDTGPLAFKPAGFDVFPEMARVYGQLGQKLAAAIDSRPKQNRFENAFIGPPTASSQAVSALSAESDIASLRSLGTYGKDEVARIEEIQRLTLELQSKSPEESIRRLTEVRKPIEALRDALKGLQSKLSQAERDTCKTLLSSFNDAAKKLAVTGAESFRTSKLKGTGTPEWEAFIAAAYKAAKHEHDNFPESSDVCLLCQQPLGTDALALFQRYWEFINGTDRASLTRLDEQIKARIKGLEALNFGIYGEDTIVRTYLAQTHPSVSENITSIISKLSTERDAVVAAMRNAGESIPADTTSNPTAAFEGILTKIDQDIENLKGLSVADAVAKLDKERAELRHREVLSKNLADIERYIADLKWCAVAETKAKPALSPRPLTTKEGDLFSKVIAESYKNRLSSECTALECSMPVEFRTRGDKGQTVRSLAIKDYALDKILSEGEQRAVALADFLTEAALNELNSGLIFDDPVNSQDHQRKEHIAARLVDESKSRQIIIFTHDLLFFTKVCAAAERAQVIPTTHWIQRGADDKPGHVSLDDAPVTTPKYRTTRIAEETLAAARSVLGSTQVELVRKGANQLRRTIEEIVPHLLLKQVVKRWDDRIMVTALKRISWDDALIKEIIDVFELCSAIMEGHSHTESGTEAPPTAISLENLIERTKNIIAKAKTERQ